MGIFSFLGKKDRRGTTQLSEISSPRRRHDDLQSPNTPPPFTERNSSAQLDAARKTALKIDAIEFEMSSELTRPPAAPQSIDGQGKTDSQPAGKQRSTVSETAAGPVPAATKRQLKEAPVSVGMTTDLVLGGDTGLRQVILVSSETAPVIEEAAVLFANEQNELAESILLEAIDNSANESLRTAWGMLFDLYQIAGRQAAFENLAIRYAGRFETSPPPWIVPAPDGAHLPGPPGRTSASVAFSGKLDETFQKQLDRVRKLGESNSMLQLDLTGITEVVQEGCTLFLGTLKKLRETGCDVELVSASEFAQKIRNYLETGRREQAEAAWLLLLEILQLQGRQQDFEDASIEYCVIFEVSPPAFILSAPPRTTHAGSGICAAPPVTPPNVFRMPYQVDGKADMIGTILDFVGQHNHAILDCSVLVRVDFSAAGQLLAGLTTLADSNRVIELRNVNQLVLALFNTMGLQGVVRILPRKQ